MVQSVNRPTRGRRGAVRLLQIGNVIAAAGSGAAAVVGLVRPAALTGLASQDTASTRYYAQMYAARALPQAFLTARAATRLVRPRGGEAQLLAVAVLVQLADAAMLLRLRHRGAAGGLIAAALHGAAVAVVLRRSEGRGDRRLR